MRICYLTCGFVTSCPLLTCAQRSWGFRTYQVAAVIALSPPEDLHARAVSRSPPTIISYRDPSSDWKPTWRRRVYRWNPGHPGLVTAERDRMSRVGGEALFEPLRIWVLNGTCSPAWRYLQILGLLCYRG